MPNNIPERIWLQWHGDSSDEDELCPNYESVTWAEDKVFDRDIQFIRADVAAAAVAREREACAQIAQRVADKYMKEYRASRTDPDKVGMRQYYDGASDAGEQIADEISGRG
jgi:hypothetical protein